MSNLGHFSGVTSEIFARMVAPMIVSRVVAPIDRAHPPADFKVGKFVIFIGGGHGSGKSVVAKHVFGQLEQLGYPRRHIAHFGSDTFAGTINNPIFIQWRENFANFCRGVVTGKDDLAHKFVSKVFSRARQSAFQKGSPIVIDYHMDSPKLVLDVLGEAQAHGYETAFVAPHVRLETIKQRVENRRQQTGRPYNMEKVIESHVGFAKHLPMYFGLFDGGVILDNNSPQLRPIAQSLNGEVKVIDPVAYDELRGRNDRAVIAPVPQAGSYRAGSYAESRNRNGGPIAPGQKTTSSSVSAETPASPAGNRRTFPDYLSNFVITG